MRVEPLTGVAGDRSDTALAAFVAEHYDRLLGLARIVCRDRADAADAVQTGLEVDSLWVLDVNGRRLVVDATYSADATDGQKTELKQVTESLEFELP